MRLLVLLTFAALGFAADVAVMAGTQASLRVLANTTPGKCAQIVTDLNRLVCAMSPDNVFATLFYGYIDTVRGRLTYVSAGHEPANLVRRRGGSIRILESSGTVLGLSSRSPYAQRSIGIDAGDVLVAFTDGVSEGIERSTGHLCHGEIVRMLHYCPGMAMHELVSGIMSTATAAGETDD
jgi:serine phosphatase RsbU (regulator of sigma subunit)